MSENSVVERLVDLYISYRKKYVIGGKFGGNASYIVPKKKDGSTKPLGNWVIQKHLEGENSLAVFAGEKASKFMTFDVDDGDPETVGKVVAGLAELGIDPERVYPSFSGRKGYHVEIFFNGFVATELAERVYGQVIRSQNLDPRKVEFRPTNKQAIKLPLGVHYKTGNRCWFCERESLAPIERFDFIFEIKKVDAKWFAEMAEERCPKIEEIKKEITQYSQSPFTGVKIVDGKLPMLSGIGMTNSTMVSIAVYERSRGLGAEEITKILENWVASQDPAFITDPQSEIMQEIDRITKWVTSPTFKPHQYGYDKDAHIEITPQEMERCLSESRKFDRKFTFLTIMYTKAYGHLKISYDGIRECFRQKGGYVFNSICRMVEENKIERKTGANHLTENGYVGECNTYKLVEGDGEPPAATLTRGAFVPAKPVYADFMDIWYHAIHDAAGDKIAKVVLTAGEYEEYKLSMQKGIKRYEYECSEYECGSA